VLEHALDGLKVLFALIMEFLGFRFELVEAAFGVAVDGVLAVLADFESCLDLLGRLLGDGVSVSRVSRVRGGFEEERTASRGRAGEQLARTTLF